MQYVRNIDSDEPVMVLDKHIGGGYDEKLGYGINGSDWAAELMQLDAMGKKRIQVWINSIGGSVTDGYSICNAILNTKTKVDTYCGGIAASIAGIIFQCGRNRIMADYGILMYHNPFTTDGQGDNKMLNSFKESLMRIVCEKSGMDTQAVSLMMDRETFINADEAHTMGLCDKVVATATLNTPRAKAVSNEAGIDTQAFWKQAAGVMNSLITQNQKPIKMKMVMNRLGLSDDAAEASVLKAIEAIENKLQAAEDKHQADADAMNALQEKITAMEADQASKAQELEQAKNELATMKAEKEAAETAVKLSEAQNMVNQFASQGRIKNDEATLKAWTDKAVADMEGVRNMLESLPLNRAAVTIPVAVKEGEQKTTAASLMAKVQNNLKKK